jgi:hypothetical protein
MESSRRDCTNYLNNFYSGLATSLWIGQRASHTHVRQENLAPSPGEYLDLDYECFHVSRSPRLFLAPMGRKVPKLQTGILIGHVGSSRDSN